MLEVDLKAKISDLFSKSYPSASNAPGIGYLVLDEHQKIIRIDPIAQKILKVDESQCLGEGLERFFPPSMPPSRHKMLVSGTMATFQNAIKTGEAGEVVSMGTNASGETKTVNVCAWTDGETIPIKINLAALLVDNKLLPLAIISKSSEMVELNLTEEKRQVVQDAKLRLAEQASSTFRRELFAWSSAFQVVFGTSRIGKIFSVLTPLGLLVVLIYVALIVFKIVPPPDFSTHQNIDLSIPGTIDDEPSGTPQPAKGHPNKK